MESFSFDLIGEFAFFKKNDCNGLVYISYNFIHKPVILGIIGAIMGIPGLSMAEQGKFPEYFSLLKDINLSIKPYYHEPFKKVVTGFNNSSGLASASSDNHGQTWQIKEEVLIGNPYIKFTIFILDEGSIDVSFMEKLKTRLQKGETEYPLYFGKNEFFAYHEGYDEYEVQKLTEREVFVHSLIKKGNREDGETVSIKELSFSDFDPFDLESVGGNTIYEHLPYDFDNQGFYKKDIFMFTQKKLIINKSDGFYTLQSKAGKESFNVQFI